MLPLSYRLITFDTALLVKKSLNTLIQNGIVSAPLWDAQTTTFAGMLTTSDYINVVQYYWQNSDAFKEIDRFRLNSLRGESQRPEGSASPWDLGSPSFVDVEKALGVVPIETISAHPHKPLYEACRRMLISRARRIPLVDVDHDTNRQIVVSVITQYRILKFVAVNVSETRMLRKPLKDLNVGTYENVATAKMETPVIKVIIDMLVKRSISSVPIVDDDGRLSHVPIAKRAIN